jgi:hypothetical protein
VDREQLATEVPSGPCQASRGGLTREQLEPLVADGLSIRAIADRLGVSYTTVRHWLARHDLATTRARRLAESFAARETGLDRIALTCSEHGTTMFRRRSGGGYRCLKCRSEAVIARRRRVKDQLVEAAGGRCAICRYNRSVAALQFHHMDPAEKAFSIAYRGVTRSLEAALAEARKCVLLCANCHAEVEAGVATLPPFAADHGSRVAQSGVAQLADASGC